LAYDTASAIDKDDDNSHSDSDDSDDDNCLVVMIIYELYEYIIPLT